MRGQLAVNSGRIGGWGEAAGEHQDRWDPTTDVPDIWKESSRPKKVCVLFS
jgi:hypothetical protein